MSIRIYTTTINVDKKFDVEFTPQNFTMSGFPRQNAISSLSVLSGTESDIDRIKHNTFVFNSVSASGGTGSDARFDVTVNTFTGAVTSVSIRNNGLNYTLDDELTIDGTKIGEDSPDTPLRNLVLTVAGVSSNGEITAATITSGDSPESDRVDNFSPSIIQRSVPVIPDSPNSSSGNLGSVDITLDRVTGEITAVELNDGGGNYNINDVLKVSNADISIPAEPDSPVNIETLLFNFNNSPVFNSPNSPASGNPPDNIPVFHLDDTPLPDSPFLFLRVDSITNTEYNGKYKLNGFVNDRPNYTLDSPNSPNSPSIAVNIRFEDNFWKINDPDRTICINSQNLAVPPRDGWVIAIGSVLSVADQPFVPIYNSPNSPASGNPPDNEPPADPNLDVVRLTTKEDSPYLKNELVTTKGSFKSANVDSPNTLVNAKIIVNDLGELFTKGEILQGLDSKVTKTILSIKDHVPPELVIEEPVEEIVIPLGGDEVFVDSSPFDTPANIQGDTPTGIVLEGLILDSPGGILVASDSPLSGISTFGFDLPDGGTNSPGVADDSSPS